ncbi:hypothetical protein PVK06_024340 [Gossypium arboreum]|uniref:Uncharacterized protein n=1 Tax=Gossypium arboreum TaxID=29729 RepID=A0ABR0PDV0_GOSAR|nr:hypothetical protein PVK06_024340 [Gossypium arboreum]
MAEDWILETCIHNLSSSAPHVIKQYLEEVRFLHVSYMLRRVDWIPHLSMHWWKDGDSRHTHSILHAVSVKSHLRP